jgi:hypothetical protein
VGKGFFSYKEGKTADREPIAVPENAARPDKGSNWERFFKAVRSRKAEDQSVSTLDAHFSCVHCQLGNISYRMGRSLEFDPKTERFKETEANKYVSRDYRKGFEVARMA